MSCCKQLGNGFEAVEISLGGESVCEIVWKKYVTFRAYGDVH